MNAIQFSEFGNPDVLRAVELPDPTPGPGEALVRIETTGKVLLLPDGIRGTT